MTRFKSMFAESLKSLPTLPVYIDTDVYHFFSVDRWRLHLSAGLSERVVQVCQPPSGSPKRTTDWLTTANHLRWVNVWTQLRSSELILALVSLLLENSMATKLKKKGFKYTNSPFSMAFLFLFFMHALSWSSFIELKACNLLQNISMRTFMSCNHKLKKW